MNIPCEGCLIFPVCYNKNTYRVNGNRVFDLKQFYKCSTLMTFRRQIINCGAIETEEFLEEMRKLFKVGFWYENPM